VSDPERKPFKPALGSTRVMILPEDDDGAEDPAAEHTDGGSDSDFVMLGGGRYYVKRWAIDGLAWEPYYIDDEFSSGSLCAWRLVVVFADFKIQLFGQEARDLLEQLGLPTMPPERP
jgi:hypothetical protein